MTLVPTATIPDDQNENSSIVFISEQKSCNSDEINSEWKCSNGASNYSSCVRNCAEGSNERKKCICQRSNCSWFQKSECASLNSTMTQSSISGDQLNSDFLRSIIHYLRLVNKGEINVNFHLR